VLGADVGAEAGERPRTRGTTTGVVELSVGVAAHPTGPGRGRQRALVEEVEVEPDLLGQHLHHVADPQRAHGRQEPAGGVGPVGDPTGRVLRETLARREADPRAVEREGDVAGAHAHPERRGLLGPGARRDHHALPVARRLERPEHLGQAASPVDRVVDDPEDVGAPPILARRPVPRGRGVTPIGDEAPDHPVREVVVWEEHHAQLPEEVGLVVAQVGQLHHRVRRIGERSTCTHPGRGAAEIAHQPFGVHLHRRVPTEQSRAQESAVAIEQDEPVGLGRDRERVDPERPAGVATRVDDRLPPAPGVDVLAVPGAGAVVGRLPGDEQPTVVGVP